MLSWQPFICCISTCILRFAGLLPVSTVFMMLIFVQLAPENIWRGGSCQLGDVPRVKTANNWKEPVLRSIWLSCTCWQAPMQLASVWEPARVPKALNWKWVYSLGLCRDQRCSFIKTAEGRNSNSYKTDMLISVLQLMQSAMVGWCEFSIPQENDSINRTSV